MSRRRPGSRLVALLLSLLVCAGSLAGDEFIISYWWGPPAADDPGKRYAEIAECNFTHAGFPGAPPPWSKTSPSSMRAKNTG